jgi:hypothetical protein
VSDASFIFDKGSPALREFIAELIAQGETHKEQIVHYVRLVPALRMHGARTRHAHCTHQGTRTGHTLAAH